MLMTIMNRTLDANLILKDAGAVIASGACQVGGSNRIIDLMNPGGTGVVIPPTAGMTAAPHQLAVAIIDVSLISGTNVSAVIQLQASSSPTFASDIINLCQLELATGTGKTGGATVDAAAGRYLLIGQNWQARNARQYLRGFHVIGGTTPNINYTMRLGMLGL